MKILQINSVCGIGSTGRIVLDLHKTLLNQNYESYIVYGRGYSPSFRHTIKVSSNTDNRLHGIYTRITDKHGFASRNATKSLIKIIEKLQPDIIHLHNIHGYYLNINLLFCYLKTIGRPIVWTLHDCWAFTGHCAYFDYAECNRWKAGCYKCPQKKSYPSSRIIDNSKWNYEKKRELFTSVDNLTLITPSRWLEELVKESYLKKRTIVTINNGIDLSVFYPRVTNEARSIIKEKYMINKPFVILGVASVWEERKGLKYLLELSQRLNNDYFQVVVVGVNEDQKAKLPDTVIGITKTNNVDELSELYSAANVFVNPTLEDNFPTTNIEALACATPVITFNTGGSPESIDETCGIVVEKGNIDALIKAVLQVKDDSINPKACLNRARLFDKNDKFADYINVYKNILK